MAAAQTQKAPEAPKPPSGFVDSTRPDIDGWFVNEVNNLLYGKIRGHMIIKQKDTDGKMRARDVVLVELHQDTKGKNKGDEETKLFKKGQVLGVSVSYDLKEMLEYVEKRGEVWVNPIKKTKIDGGRTVWKFEQHYKGQKAPLQASSPRSRATSDVPDDDDIPF